MHPILARPARLASYLAGWLVVGALIAGAVSRRGLSVSEAVVFVLPPLLVYAFICLSAWYVCRAVPLRTSGALRVLAACSLAAAVAAGLWFGLALAWVALLESMPGRDGLAEAYGQQTPFLLSVAVLLFLLALAVHYLVLAFEETREADRQRLALQVHARDAELRALRAQLNPHFLYNCLNSIGALTTVDPSGARRMCLMLGEFLRTTLHAGALARIALADELALADRFLSIEQVRFGSRLEIERRIDEAALSARVPPLFLQPLVENAVIHGIASLLDGGIILLDVRRAGGRLVIAIENACDPELLTPMRHGTGLTNVRDRLHALFGSAATMTARAHQGRFRVELNLPLSVDD